MLIAPLTGKVNFPSAFLYCVRPAVPCLCSGGKQRRSDRTRAGVRFATPDMAEATHRTSDSLHLAPF